MANKTREDFTDSEIKKVHAELEGLASVEERGAVYKKHGASRQAFSNWFHVLGLPQLSEAKAAPLTPKRGVGRPKGSVNAKKAVGRGPKKGTGRGPKAGSKGGAAKSKDTPKGTGLKRGRPVGSGRARGLGLSNDAKETLIRLLADQTAMMRRLLES